MLPIVLGYFIPLSMYNLFKERIEEGVWYEFDPWANSSDCLSEKCSNGKGKKKDGKLFDIKPSSLKSQVSKTLLSFLIIYV